MKARSITNEELRLVEYLISISKNKPESLTIPSTVYIMDDGGMGSIRFTSSNDKNIYKRELIEVEYIDEDNTPVSISLNLNTADKLFELDIFKCDFSPLKKYPIPDNVQTRK